MISPSAVRAVTSSAVGMLSAAAIIWANAATALLVGVAIVLKASHPRRWRQIGWRAVPTDKRARKRAAREAKMDRKHLHEMARKHGLRETEPEE